MKANMDMNELCHSILVIYTMVNVGSLDKQYLIKIQSEPIIDFDIFGGLKLLACFYRSRGSKFQTSNSCLLPKRLHCL